MKPTVLELRRKKGARLAMLTAYDYPTARLVAEADLAAYAGLKQFPIIPCTLCGSQDNLQRKLIGEMLRDWEKRHPGRIESMLRAMTEVRPSHLLDRKLFDFASL